jgi:hypothetical protein
MMIIVYLVVGSALGVVVGVLPVRWEELSESIQ